MSLNLYRDYKEKVITQEEFVDFKSHFTNQEIILQEEISNLKREKKDTKEKRKEKAVWMKQFIECRGIEELSRDILLKLIKEIRVYDKDRIEILFRFKEEFEQARAYIEHLADNNSKEEWHNG